jgi:hypothetical protein
VVYLVIILLVAVAGIARLWRQHRRKESQMDTIDRFYSALEAMSPRFIHSRRASTIAARQRQRPRVRRNSLAGWFVAQPAGARLERRAVARSRIDARRAAPSRRYQITRLHPRNVGAGTSQ